MDCAAQTTDCLVRLQVQFEDKLTGLKCSAKLFVKSMEIHRHDGCHVLYEMSCVFHSYGLIDSPINFLKSCKRSSTAQAWIACMDCPHKVRIHGLRSMDCANPYFAPNIYTYVCDF